MPTIHVSDDLMEEIEAQKNSKDEPPTVTLKRMLDMDKDGVRQIVRSELEKLSINQRTGELEMM